MPKRLIISSVFFFFALVRLAQFERLNQENLDYSLSPGSTGLFGGVVLGDPWQPLGFSLERSQQQVERIAVSPDGKSVLGYEILDNSIRVVQLNGIEGAINVSKENIEIPEKLIDESFAGIKITDSGQIYFATHGSRKDVNDRTFRIYEVDDDQISPQPLLEIADAAHLTDFEFSGDETLIIRFNPNIAEEFDQNEQVIALYQKCLVNDHDPNMKFTNTESVVISGLESLQLSFVPRVEGGYAEMVLAGTTPLTKDGMSDVLIVEVEKLFSQPDDNRDKVIIATKIGPFVNGVGRDVSVFDASGRLVLSHLTASGAVADGYLRALVMVSETETGKTQWHLPIVTEVGPNDSRMMLARDTYQVPYGIFQDGLFRPTIWNPDAERWVNQADLESVRDLSKIDDLPIAISVFDFTQQVIPAVELNEAKPAGLEASGY